MFPSSLGSSEISSRRDTFFLDFDDGFCLLQAAFEFAIFSFELQNPLGILGSECGRCLLAGFGFGCVESSSGALPAESREGGMGDASALEEFADLSGLVTGVGFV